VTLRIGILGAARVATYAMIAPAHAVDGVTVAGVAARDHGRAELYAREHGIAHVFADYAALIASPTIDAVYVALPPNLHAHWSIAALEAGKPVLCEKPFALTLADVEVMLDAEARTGVLLMEAQHSHYHPMNIRARAIMRSGVLGPIRHIAARFDAPVPDVPGELRYLPDVGGGALWDLGVYPAYWIRSLMGAEPEVVSATQRLHAGGADIETTAQLRMTCGATGTLTTNMQSDFVADVRITGAHGTLTLINPLAPPRGHDLMLTIDGTTTHEQFPLKPSYEYQLEAFRDCLAHGTKPPTGGADTRATIAMLAAIQTIATKD
jgi:predicted dehydrogenase